MGKVKLCYISKNLIKILLIVAVIFILIFQISIFYKQAILKSINTENKIPPKIVLIGIDTIDLKIISKLIKLNKLPNFAILMKEGSFGKLKATFPMVPAALFTSVVTGKSYEKHGIQDSFFKYDNENELRPITSKKRKAKALWNIFSENNKKVGVVNWLVSYPVEEVKGFIASNYFFFWPPMNKEGIFKSIQKKDIAYPESILDEAMNICQVSGINKVYIETLLTQNFLTNINIFTKLDSFKSSLAKGINTEMQLTEISSHLYRRYLPDFFAIYYWAIDAVQHLFWKYIDYEDSDGKTSQEDMKKYGKMVFDTYEYYDKMLGKLLKSIDENSIIIIASPLEFSPNKQVISYSEILNFIFEKKGWLAYRRDKPDEPDWQKTRLYDFGHYLFWRPVRSFLYVNPKEHNDKIKYNLFMEEIKNLKDEVKTINGDDVIISIKLPPPDVALQGGKQLSNLVINLKSGVNYNSKFQFKIKDKIYVMDKKINKPSISSLHNPSGIIIIFGKNIKKGAKIKEATIFDISPTILALAGLPVPNDMDGRVITDVIEKEFLNKYPVTYIPSYENPRKDIISEGGDISINEYKEYFNNRLKTQKNSN